MTVTIPDVMRHVRNHFVTAAIDGRWQATGGMLSPATQLHPGRWIAIVGGPLSGIHQLDEHGAISGAADAAWEGRILLLEPPADFLRLCSEIADWAKKHPDPAVTSERFGEYSRSQSTAAWTRAFAPALAPYIRMYPEVNL